MRKNEMSIMKGRNAHVKSDVLTRSPSVLVRKMYNPDPARPAAPVPLPHAAKLNGP